LSRTFKTPQPVPAHDICRYENKLVRSFSEERETAQTRRGLPKEKHRFPARRGFRPAMGVVKRRKGFLAKFSFFNATLVASKEGSIRSFGGSENGPLSSSSEESPKVRMLVGGTSF
jgi:hypothetical protein